jgi:hypothetical protein
MTFDSIPLDEPEQLVAEPTWADLDAFTHDEVELTPDQLPAFLASARGQVSPRED